MGSPLLSSQSHVKAASALPSTCRPAPLHCLFPGLPLPGRLPEAGLFSNSTPADSRQLRDPGLPDVATLHFPSTTGVILPTPTSLNPPAPLQNRYHRQLRRPRQNGTGGGASPTHVGFPQFCRLGVAFPQHPYEERGRAISLSSSLRPPTLQD